MRGICRNCDTDQREHADHCYIVVEEIDYGTVATSETFCSWYCLKRWYDL